MIKKSKQKVYYEQERIESVSCDKCKKELTEEDDFYTIQVEFCYYEKGNQWLDNVNDIGYKKLLCEDCAKPILELLN